MYKLLLATEIMYHSRLRLLYAIRRGFGLFTSYKTDMFNLMITAEDVKAFCCTVVETKEEFMSEADRNLLLGIPYKNF